ncbi:MAG TPA: tail fiber domain-containing protein [Steroidobacteraceae bacterium]|nr:tail fiber domain-containing protein [Steroidobacteraceae bacterium]
MTDPNTWSPIDDSNNQSSPDGWPEGMMPSGVNNSARAMMGGLRRWYERANAHLGALGTENALIVPYSAVDPIAGDTFLISPTSQNTGPATLDVGTGAMPIRFRGEALLRGGELQPSVPTLFVFGGDGNWYLGPPAGGPTVSSLPLIGSLGTPNAQTLTYTSGAPTALVVGDRFTFFPLVADNTGPVTLNIQGLGAYPVLADTLPLVGGEMQQYAVLDVVWDGTQFQLLNPGLQALSATYLPITGGSMTGGLTVPTLAVTGTSSLNGAVTANAINASTVAASGAISAATAAIGGAITGGSVAAPTITGTSVVNAAQYQVGGIAFCTQSGALRTIYDTGGTSNIAMYTTGENYYDNQQHIFRSRGASATYAIFNGAGTYNNSGSWSTISDADYKTNVAPYERGLEAVLQLAPVSFEYAGGPFREAGTTRYGFVAQDVEPVIPEMVGRIEIDEQQIATLAPGMLVPILVNCIKELTARIQALEAK